MSLTQILFYTMKGFRTKSLRDSFAETSQVVRSFSSRLKVTPLFPVIRETLAGDDGTVLSRVSLSRSSFLKPPAISTERKHANETYPREDTGVRHSQMNGVVVRRASK